MDYNTRSRRELLEFFSRQGDEAKKTDEICEALEGAGVGKSTVYRRLAALCREGTLTRFRAADGEYVYRYTGKKECDCAFHLKCVVCGCVSHLECGASEELIDHISKEHGFRIDGGRTVLYGECAECAAQNKKAGKQEACCNHSHHAVSGDNKHGV